MCTPPGYPTELQGSHLHSGPAGPEWWTQWLGSGRQAWPFFLIIFLLLAPRVPGPDSQTASIVARSPMWIGLGPLTPSLEKGSKKVSSSQQDRRTRHLLSAPTVRENIQGLLRRTGWQGVCWHLQLIKAPFLCRECGATSKHQVASGAPQGAVWGSKGGGRICKSLDTLEGHITSPPQKNLSWGLLLCAEICTVKWSKFSSRFHSSSITEASNLPNTWALGELLQVVVSVIVGQVSVQLAEVTVLLPDHHLFDILWIPLWDGLCSRSFCTQFSPWGGSKDQRLCSATRSCPLSWQPSQGRANRWPVSLFLSWKP